VVKIWSVSLGYKSSYGGSNYHCCCVVHRLHSDWQMVRQPLLAEAQHTYVGH
jgi:hypothetical protein